MKVFEIKLKVFLLKDIYKTEVQERVTNFIDGTLALNKDMLLLHEDKQRYKLYSYGGLQNIEKSGLYSSGNIYNIIIRTVDQKLARYLYSFLPKYQNHIMKGLIADIHILPKRILERIYTQTPAIIKNDSGYWRDCLSFEEYEQRIKINLIKKYRQFCGKNMKDTIPFYTSIQIDNKKPIAVTYKGIKLLGDKLTLYIANDTISQELAYFALGVGLGEMNSRGFSFVKGYYEQVF